MNLPTPTATRVSANTDPAINERIARKTEAAIREAARGGKEAITRRLAQLDQEWDVERCLETGASAITLLGLALGATTDRRWYLLPAAVGGFLLQHALQGWCPPLPVLRRLGVRTAEEINKERYALKALRGDVIHIGPVQAPAAEAAGGAAKEEKRPEAHV